MKLLMIDGANLLRCLHDLGTVPDSGEKADRTMWKGLELIRKLVQQHKPTHIMVHIEDGQPSWRHSIFPQYRAKEREVSPFVMQRTGALQKVLRHEGIYCFSVPAAETCDVLATAAARWLERGRDVGEIEAFSTDLRVVNLAASGLRVSDPFKGRIFDDAWCLEKHGVPLALLADLIAVGGHYHSGYPGISRVGAKTAARLLNQYGGFENLLAHASEINGVVGENIRAEARKVMVSAMAIKPKTDLTLGLTWRIVSCGPRGDLPPAQAGYAHHSLHPVAGSNGPL